MRVLARIVPDTKSGTPGADAVKVKGTIGWVGAHEAQAIEVRLFERLFVDDQPEAGGRDFRQAVSALAEPALAQAAAEDRFQFERHGYFVADRVDHRADRPVFNRITPLKEAWR